MSLKIKEINEHSKPIKFKKDLILNTDLFNSKTLRISQKNNKKKIIINKEALKSLIDEKNFTFRSNNKLKYPIRITSLENKQKNIKVNNHKMIFNDKNKIRINKRKINIKQFRKKENMNININDINNCCNEKSQDNRIYNSYNCFNNDNYSNYVDIYKTGEYKNNLILNDIKKRCREKLYCHNYNLKKYYIKVINDIISDQDKHIVSIFKNYLIWNDPNEYLKRYYLLNECEFRLNPIALYYNSYTYCFPNYYCNLEIIKILLKNIKRKINYFNVKEFLDNKINIGKNKNNSISNYFEEEIKNDNNNEEIGFIPLVDSYDINNQSQSWSINKKSISLSSTIKYNDAYSETNLSNIIKKQKSFSNENNNRKNIFNVNITPIRNKIYKKTLLNECNDINDSHLKYNNNNIKNDNNKKKKCKNNNDKYKIKFQKVEDYESSNHKIKPKIKLEKIVYGNNIKKMKINPLKFKLEKINFNLNNKIIEKYFKTDYTDMNSNNNEKKKDNSTKKYISIKKNKNKEFNNFNYQKTVLYSFLNKNNFIRDSSRLNKNKINLKKIKINNDIKNQNIIRNYYTQRAKFLNKTNNTNHFFNNDYSLVIQSKNKNLKKNKTNKISNLEIKKNNIIRNLNYNYFNLSKYSRLLTSNDGKNNFSLKKNVEFPFRFHSLSTNKRRLLKIAENSKVKGVLKNKSNIYLNHSYNSLLSKTKRQSAKKSNKKHKKGKSDILSLKKRNILLLNTKTQKIMNQNKKYDIKNNINNNNERKLKQFSIKNKKYFKFFIDTFKNTSNNQFYKDNCRNNTFQNLNKSYNMNKLKNNTIRRKCKSNSPNITNSNKKSLKINKKKPNLKVLNTLFVVSEKFLNNKNNNDNSIYNYENNYTLNFDNNIRLKKLDYKIIKKKLNKNKNETDKSNINHIKQYSPGMSSISNRNMNVNTNRVINKKINKSNNNINIIYSKNKLNIKNNMKSSILKQLNNKKKNYNSNIYMEKSKLKQNSINKNINKLNNNNINNHHMKRLSIQLNYDKIYNNKRKDNFNKSKLLSKNNNIYLSINNSKNQFKNNLSLNINKELTEYLTERKIYNKDINISNINDSQNSYSKDMKNKKNANILSKTNKNINSLKNKILLGTNKTNKTQNRPMIEDRSYKTRLSNHYAHRKMLTNITSSYENPIKRHTYDILKRNIYKYYYRNSKNKELSLKKYCKSNCNKLLLNYPIKKSIINEYKKMM